MTAGDVAIPARVPSERFALATGQMSVGAVVDAARTAEALGYEAVLVGEAALEADAFVCAAAVLSATSRVRCGPGIANVVDRHPLALARAAATLDHLAPGRALLGLGRSEPAYTEGVVGFDYALTGAALEDALRICRPLLAGGPAAHDGRVWSTHVEAAPARSAANSPVPLVLAAVGPWTLRLAGRLADAVLLNYGSSPAYVRRAAATVAEAAERAGRDPATVDVYGYVLVARTDRPDGGRRRDSVAATLRSLLDQPAQAAALLGEGGGPPAEIDEAVLRRHAAVGDATACAARIEEYRAAGLRCPVLLPSGMRALHLDAGASD